MKTLMRRGDSKKIKGGTHYFLILYDFVASNPLRDKFYKKAAKLLGRSVGKNTSSYSAIQTCDAELAHNVFALAVECGAQSALLISASTILSHPRKDDDNASVVSA
jgi:hypothetical protein